MVILVISSVSSANRLEILDLELSKRVDGVYIYIYIYIYIQLHFNCLKQIEYSE
jgi:hypothetical protein